MFNSVSLHVFGKMSKIFLNFYLKHKFMSNIILWSLMIWKYFWGIITFYLGQKIVIMVGIVIIVSLDPLKMGQEMVNIIKCNVITAHHCTLSSVNGTSLLWLTQMWLMAKSISIN